MIEIASQDPKNGATRAGGQPIALAASALIVIVLGASAMALWRSPASTPAREQDRIAATIPLQVNTAQLTDELSEKTRALEATQQESIDQLQSVEDQLQTTKQLLAAQQEDIRRLSAQVSSLAEAITSLRQSFASARAAEASAPTSQKRSASSRTAGRKRAKPG
jgi:uncharacterized protein HemX